MFQTTNQDINVPVWLKQWPTYIRVEMLLRMNKLNLVARVFWMYWTRFKTCILSGWWFQPFWKIWKSVGMVIPNKWKVIIHSCSSHHQPVTVFFLVFMNQFFSDHPTAILCFIWGKTWKIIHQCGMMRNIVVPLIEGIHHWGSIPMLQYSGTFYRAGICRSKRLLGPVAMALYEKPGQCVGIHEIDSPSEINIRWIWRIDSALCDLSIDLSYSSTIITSLFYHSISAIMMA